MKPPTARTFSGPDAFCFSVGIYCSRSRRIVQLGLYLRRLLPFCSSSKCNKRNARGFIGLSSIYLCIAVLLVILLNVSADRSSSDLNKVFFTASHALFAIMIGYGLTLLPPIWPSIMTEFGAGDFRRHRAGDFGFIVSQRCDRKTLLRAPPAWSAFPSCRTGSKQAFAKDQYGLPVFANLILVAMPIVFIGALAAYPQNAPGADLLDFSSSCRLFRHDALV